MPNKSHQKKKPLAAKLNPKGPSVISKTRLALSAALLALALGSVYLARTLPKLATPPVLSSDFRSEPVKIDFAQLDLSTNLPPDRIIMPSVGIDLPVKTSPIKNGYWVVWPDEAGFGEGSAPPGVVGNTVIFAHAKEGLFLPLKDAEIGNRVYVLSQNTSFAYEVTEIKSVLPHEIEVIAPTSDKTLTLYTCTGFLDKKRLIIIAKPV